MLSTFSARDPGVIRRLGVVISWVTLLLVVPLRSGAQEDVCGLVGTAMQTKLETGAAEIAEAYARTSGQLSLNESPSTGKVQQACNWTCGSNRVITPMIKAFGFLQYNCSSTTAPPGTRRRTGRNTDSEMGLSITDNDYRKETDKIFRSGSTGVGDLMRVPTKLEDASKSGKVQELVNAVEAIPGATWMKFSSTSVSNDTDGAARIIIRVPDTKESPRFEQWIQIAINKSSGKLGRNVDFLGVQLVPDPTSPLSDGQPMMAFRGFSRTPEGFVPEGGSASQLSKCYSCHPSGLRPVIPAPQGTQADDGSAAIKPEGTMLRGPDMASQFENIKNITNRLGMFGPRGYTVSQNGPPLGPETRPGRAEFVEKGLPARPGRAKVPGCAVGLTALRRQKIVDQMNCEQCHDGSFDRGILNAGTSLATIRHKVVENTVAPMPPGVTDQGGLTSKERGVLFECLRAEYAEILEQWLTSDLLMVP